jgi:hypothetical protein
MTLELNEHERAYLSELLEARHAEMLHELHHTDTADFKEILRKRIALIESLRAKVGGPS